MREITPLLSCPVCLGTTMEKVSVGTGNAVQIDHCRRCAGVWLEHGEVQRLRAVKRDAMWKGIEPETLGLRMLCHDCHTPLSRADEKCASCGWKNVLDCPECDRPMRVEEHAGLRLDICRDCKGVWFDRHELSEIWEASFDRARTNRHLPTARRAGDAADVASDVLFTSIFFAPDLMFLGAHAAGQLMVGSADVISRLPGVAAGAPEAAASIFEAAGEAAGSVFEVIVDIISGLFG